ncbi:MAG: GNAT family N-acetyltransferase [Candidatus Melainabacteria bacterium]|nr:MAG: GNAT family N-acetyltransferase [Candidatus Melainabacteria bacterium]
MGIVKNKASEKKNKAPEELVIKLLSEKDVDIFWTLRLKALKDEPHSFGADYDESTALDPKEVAGRLVCNDDNFVLGAFCPDLIGYIGFVRQKTKKMRHQGTLWGLYLLPEYRGRSIARQLMVASIMYAQELPDLEYLKLTVTIPNKPATKLYKSLGFEKYGVEPAALKVDGKYVDEALMQLKLHQD